MSEENTQNLPDSRSFEERVFARFDAIDAGLRDLNVRVERLETESERRAADTKPIWERALAEMSRHLCPATLAEELEKLELDAEVYITHLKPGEIEPTMLEIAECAGRFRPQMLPNNLVLEF